ncbi:hypothetical protein AGMMS50268_20600 [Spirochaetia bacterium]|nr:hypothetical protein AGMMS50268_20600 [Spirochaetia bacterium]
MRFLKIGGKSLTDPPYNRFFDFIAPGADRFGILKSLLEEFQLNSLVLPIAGNRHFLIFPRGQGLKSSPGTGFPFRGQSPIVLAAHYDRVPQSPGANDNSAAVFHLIKAALRLEERKTGYWIIIFTDKEELGAGEGITSQGSYTLAETLRQEGLGEARVYIFDACGAGNTLIISTTTDHLLQNDAGTGARKAQRHIQGLRNLALETARNLNLEKTLLLPTPFSDDAGFLRAGIPAQTITTLPAAEAFPFAALLRGQPHFSDALLSRESQEIADKQRIPETWRSLNSPTDDHQRLTPEYYDQIIRFAVGLCRG